MLYPVLQYIASPGSLSMVRRHQHDPCVTFTQSRCRINHQVTLPSRGRPTNDGRPPVPQPAPATDLIVSIDRPRAPTETLSSTDRDHGGSTHPIYSMGLSSSHATSSQYRPSRISRTAYRAPTETLSSQTGTASSAPMSQHRLAAIPGGQVCIDPLAVLSTVALR
jgi:hypothetical protein